MQNNIIRRIIYLLIIVIGVLIIGYFVFSGRISFGTSPDDFIAYWSSGRLLLLGDNPYYQNNTMELTEQIGFGKSGFFLSYFYPPWTLPLFIPFGLISYPISRTLWFIVSIIIYTICALWIWKLYNGPKSKNWIVIFCIVIISPGIFALLEGQVTPIILAGIVGFLYFENKQKWFIAGSFLVLITFKIHVLYLLWIALFFWIVYSKKWRILAGLISTLAISSVLITIIRPSIFWEFIIMNANSLPSYCNNPTISSILCVINDNQLEIWHLLIGPVLGLLWFIPYWMRNKADWRWMDNIPIVIFISLITAPYTWMHDGMLFIIAVISTIILFLNQKSSPKKSSIVFLFGIANITVYMLAGNLRNNQIVFIWVPLVYLILYILSLTHTRGSHLPIEGAKLESHSE